VSERLLTTREVAAFLGLSPETVLRRWRAGEIPGYRLGTNVLRFDERDVLAWLEAHRESREPIGGTMPKLSAVVSDELAGALERRARAEDRSMGAVVRRALAEHLDVGTTTTPVAGQPVNGKSEPKEKKR